MWMMCPALSFYWVEMCFYIGVDQGCSCRKYHAVMAFIVVQGLTVNKQFLSGLNVSPEDYYTSVLFLQIVDSTRRTINTSNIVRQHDRDCRQQLLKCNMWRPFTVKQRMALPQ